MGRRALRVCARLAVLAIGAAAIAHAQPAPDPPSPSLRLPEGARPLLDPSFDIRETTTALWRMHWTTPAHRDAHDFVTTNFDALAARVQRKAPGGWSSLAERLCTARDDADVDAFWRERAANYATGARSLAQAREAIRLCTTLREKHGPSAAAYLARF